MFEHPSFFPRALAGVGKTAVSFAIQSACTKHFLEHPELCEDECVTVLSPSRELREDLVEETLALAAIRPEQLMWLGRRASKNSRMPRWDELVEKKIAERLVPVREELKRYEATLFSDMQSKSQRGQSIRNPAGTSCDVPWQRAQDQPSPKQSTTT